MTHEFLQKLVLDSTPALEERWSQHQSEDDILIFGDLRREEVHKLAMRELGGEAVGEAIEAGDPPMVAILQPLKFIDLMAKSADFAHREAAKELRGFASSPIKVVPLLVVFPGGLWATCWTPSSSRVLINRYDPGPTIETN